MRECAAGRRHDQDDLLAVLQRLGTVDMASADGDDQVGIRPARCGWAVANWSSRSPTVAPSGSTICRRGVPADRAKAALKRTLTVSAMILFLAD